MTEQEFRTWQVCAANMARYSNEIATDFLAREMYGPASYFASGKDIWESLIHTQNLAERFAPFIISHEKTTYREFYPIITRKLLDEFRVRDHVYLPILRRILELWQEHIVGQNPAVVMNQDNIEGGVPEQPWIDQVLAEAIAATRHKLRCSCPACKVKRQEFEGWLETKDDPTTKAESSLGKE